MRHRIAVLALDHVAALGLAIPIQVFGAAFRLDRPADQLIGPRLYDIQVCGDRRGVTVDAPDGSPAYRMVPEYDIAAVLTADTVVVPGAPARPTLASDPVLRVLRTAHDRGTRIAATCSGVFVPAQAGLIDGVRLATHWTWADPLRAQFPTATVDPDVLYVAEGQVVSAAGGGADVDLCLALIGRDFGAAVAAETARHLVAPPRRAGDSPQAIAHTEPTDSATLEPTLHWMQQNLHRPLRLSDIAGHAAMSTRTLRRHFLAQTGTSPLQWLIQQRVSRAQELLESSDLSVEAVADAAGFGSALTLRHHFGRVVHATPTTYRRSYR